MIQVVNLKKSFGTQLLFEKVTFSLGKGERIGLVGKNGSGKSTLFKILLGEESCDDGEVIFPKNYVIGTLRQHMEFKEVNIIQECMTALKGDIVEFEKYKVEKMLLGLGFKSSDFERPPSEFSGGYQIRLNLAKVLLSDPDCLLLDEPTNYLDIISMRWLVKFLKGFRGELILITHDRGFMDELITHTIGIWRQKLLKVTGITLNYFEQILLEEENYEKTRQNVERKRKDLQLFVDRFRAKASKASQAQSKMKILEKMPEIKAMNFIANLDFEFNFNECPGKVLLEINDLSFGYSVENLINNFNISVLKNDKIGIIGKNGKGKSTLLNLLAGELKPKTGNIQRNVNLLVGHFGQTNISRLNLENTIEDEILGANPSIGVQRARAIAGTMMFSGELAKKNIKFLSGGERSRVLLGKILAKPTNLLLLDEPTNHLDQESVESLTLELQNYPGAVIVVTHSESMLRDFANKLIVFQDEKINFHCESYDDFLKKIGWTEEESTKENVRTSHRPSRQDMKRMRADLVVQRGRELSPLKKKMDFLESKIIELEFEQKKLEDSMIDLATQGEGKKIQETSLHLNFVKNNIEKAFEELSEISHRHDLIFKSYELKLNGLEDE